MSRKLVAIIGSLVAFTVLAGAWMLPLAAPAATPVSSRLTLVPVVETIVTLPPPDEYFRGDGIGPIQHTEFSDGTPTGDPDHTPSSITVVPPCGDPADTIKLWGWGTYGMGSGAGNADGAGGDDAGSMNGPIQGKGGGAKGGGGMPPEGPLVRMPTLMLVSVPAGGPNAWGQFTTEVVDDGLGDPAGGAQSVGGGKGGGGSGGASEDCCENGEGDADGGGGIDGGAVSGCGGCGGKFDGGRSNGGIIYSLRSILVRVSLGMVNDRLDAGMLKLHAEEMASVLGRRAALTYDRQDEAGLPGNPRHGESDILFDPNDVLRQIKTTNILADLVDISTGADPSYEIRFYYAGDVTKEPNAPLYEPDVGAEIFRKHVVSYDDSADTLTISDYVRTDAGLALRGYVVYAQSGGVTTLVRKSAGGVSLQRETLTDWSATGDIRSRVYSSYGYASDGSGEALVYREYEEQSKLTYYEADANDPNDDLFVWRRTKRVVDPNDLALTTDWTYSTDRLPGPYGYHGVVLQSVKWPDGSWVWYNIGPTDDWTANEPPPAGEPWMIQAITGLKDEPMPAGAPDIDDSDMHSQTRVYSRRARGQQTRYMLTSLEERIGTTVVRKWEIDVGVSGDGGSLRRDWLDAAGTKKLTTTTDWTSDPLFDIDYRCFAIAREFPDGRVDTYISPYESFKVITPAAPLSQHTIEDYTEQELEAGQVLCRRSLVDHKGTDGNIVIDESTRRETHVDHMGNVWLEEEFYSTGTGLSDWASIGWTCRTFDQRGRITASWNSRGELTTYDYDSCCIVTMTDPSGVTTETTRDFLGRVTQVVRSAPGQASITVTHSYGPFSHTTTTSGFTSQTVLREFDILGRVKAITTGTGDARLKTLFSYAIPTGAGWKVTRYDAYAHDASSGAAGTRDAITQYYRDGNVKSVTGASVVERHFDHGVASGLRFEEVTIGSPTSTRVETTYRDAGGRVVLVERPGWSASPPGDPIATEYTYEDDTSPPTGRLLKVAPTSQPATLYSYDEMSHVKQTVLDLNGDGDIDIASDRISETESHYEDRGSGVIWHESSSYLYLPGESSPTLTGTTATRLKGFTGSSTSEFIIGESESIDISGNVTATTIHVERDAATRRVVTDAPESGTDAEAEYVGGRLMSSETSAGVTTAYAYDNLGRQVTVTDARGNTTTTTYDDAGRVLTVADELSNTTTYAYYLGTDSSSGSYPGRLKSIANPANKKAYFTYTARGEVFRTWGDVPYPTESVYDSFGQRTSLKTFRGGTGWEGSSWPGSPGTADTTTWNYDVSTGLLNDKTYTDSTQVVYTYSEDGKLLTRDWARAGPTGTLTTTYGYDANTAELTSVNYEDSTHDVTYTYDRLGRMATVEDAVGTREFDYDPNTLAPTTETFTAGMFDDKVISTVYQASGDVNYLAGRWNGVQIGTSGNPSADYAAKYDFDALGRLDHVTGPGLPTGDGTNNGAWYGFLQSGETELGLLDTLEFKDSGGTVKARTDWSYEAQRDLVTAIANNFGMEGSPTLLSQYAYGYDNLARREHVVRSGAAFSGGSGDHLDLWDYDSRNEVTQARRYATTQPASTQPANAVYAADQYYAYDPIGNRLESDEGRRYAYPPEPVDPNDPDPPPPDPNAGYNTSATYVANALNQYERLFIESGPQVRLEYDADGNLIEKLVFGDIDGDTDVDLTDLALLVNNYGLTCASHSPLTDAQYHRADANGDCNLDTTDLSYLLTSYGTAASSGNYVGFTWDAENRLVAVTPLIEPIPSGLKRVEFGYDYLGRRVEKRVFDRASGSAWNANPTEQRRFVWGSAPAGHEWLMLMEIVATDTTSPPDGSFEATRTRRHTWGRDLSSGGPAAGRSCGTGLQPVNCLTGAGAIGGLLAVDDDNATTTGGSPTADDLHYVYMYDANGNVGQVVDWNESTAAASLKAKYEYDVYGNATSSTGAFAAINPFRFSTKFWDDETGLGYWGYRYYDPRLGRWVSRDLVDLPNMYDSLMNAPTQLIDPDGRMSMAPVIGIICRLIGPMGRLLPPLSLLPPGDCTPEQYAELKGRVDQFCKHGKRNIGQPPKKSPTKAWCDEAKDAAVNATMCAMARSQINNECFRGGDWTHQDEERRARDASREAWYTFKRYCNWNCDPLPQPAPAPVPCPAPSAWPYSTPKPVVYFCPLPAAGLPVGVAELGIIQLLRMLGMVGCGAAAAAEPAWGA